MDNLRNPKTHISIINRITPLSQAVTSQLAATKEITNLETVVLGLLENSLDAHASKIEININFARRSCEIEDNGQGIPAQEFKDDGGLCKRHHTSKEGLPVLAKAHSSDGTFLISLATLSLLHITSKIADNEEAAFLSLHHGQVLARLRRAPVRHDLIAFPHYGTRVVVDDVFGNMPVRVKQNALLMEDVRAVEQTCERLKHSIVGILLAWNRPCSVKLQYASTPRTILLTASHPSISHALTTRAVKALGRRPPEFSLQDKLPLLFQAGFANLDSRKRWIPVSASNSRYSVKGLICLTPAPSMLCQFISLGITPLITNGKAILYETINKLFADSTFGVEDEQKGVDKWPMFVLNISSSLDASVGSSLGRGDLDRLLDLLHKVMTQWLVVQQFQPRRKKKSKQEVQSRSQTCKGPVSDIAVWTPAARQGLSTERSVIYDPPWTRIRSLQSLSINQAQDRPVTAPEERHSTSALLSRTMEVQEHSDGHIRWQDPRTKQNLLVDGRTGMTMPTHCSRSRSTPRHSTHKVPLRNRTASTGSLSKDLPIALQSWQPSVFASPAQEAIPSVLLDVATEHILHPGRSLLRCQPQAEVMSHKLTKEGLDLAKVIAQVDAKFILCTLPVSDEKKSHLVLVDQHAASERVLLEELLKELCIAKQARTSTMLLKPIVFETTEQEGVLLRNHSGILGEWGILYTLQDTRLTSTLQGKSSTISCRVSVHALPSAISERCRTAPNVLITLLRSEIWRLRDAPRKSQWVLRSYSSLHGDADWLAHIGSCPRGILDLVNSRACRSAIMFNDELSVDDCKKLIHQLARTTFPFMCAHGRTSAVPLLTMDNRPPRQALLDDFQLHGFTECQKAFTSAYTQWIQP